jgi:hypothetical protein
LAFISSAGRSLYTKLNLVSIMFSLTKSSLKWADKPKEDLEKIEKDLNNLRRAYEFALEKSDYAFEKRSIFEARLYTLFERITMIIENFDLLDASIVQEVYATRWRG